MKKKFLTIFVLLALISVVFCGCNKSDSLSSAQKASVENATSVVCQASLYSGKNEVYRYVEEMNLRDTDMVVLKTVWQLEGSDFTLKDTTKTQTVELDRSKFQLLSLDGNAEITDRGADETESDVTNYSGTVAKDKIAALLQTTLQATGDGTFTAKVSDGKMQQFELTFEIADSSNGALIVEYSCQYTF